VISCLRNYLDRLVDGMCCGSLFAAPPIIMFRPKDDCCPDCGVQLKVLKTRTRQVVTLHIGQFRARELVLVCDKCRRTFASEELSHLVAPSCNFGYDVMVYVGKALFLRHRSAREICAELGAINIRISPSEVGALGKKFIIYLATAHRQCAKKIRQSMHSRGGYIFHLDATCEGSGTALMSGLDSITKIVLGNIKLPSEKTEAIVPFLREIKKLFGAPVALVHDMGPGILKAVAGVFGNTPDFICHYHFLRDIGNDLFSGEYDIIRKRLRKHGITSKLRRRAKILKQLIDDNPSLVGAFSSGVLDGKFKRPILDLAPTASAYSLIHYALDGKNQGNGYGFPFDRPHLVFAQRLCLVYEKLEQTKNIHLRGQWRDNKPLLKLSCELKPVFFDTVLQRAITAITSKIKTFDQLRDAMRIAPKSGTQGLNCDNTHTSIGAIEQSVVHFRRRLIANDKYSTTSDYHKMIAQIDKYRDKLFADPIIVDTPDGKVSIQPQRTNNIMERFFRDLKRGYRRKSGNKSMSKTLQTMLADTPLVKNLENPEYIQLLLGKKTKVEQLFAAIDAKTVRKQLLQAQMNPERIPAEIKKIIAMPGLPQIVATIFRSYA
jgi:hypothetical protein